MTSVARLLAGLAGALIVAGTAVPAAAASAPDRGRAFEPAPLSEPLYSTIPPSANPELQQHYVEARDGVDLYVETWLPGPKDGREPPARVPTILIMSPYLSQGAEAYGPSGGFPSFIEYFTARGYAVAQHHVRGTGESGGCLEQTAQNQIDDGGRVIEYLGHEAPWSNGRVGMYGASYDAETQISVAGLGDRRRTRYLKAIVPVASVGGQYDWNLMDGVPWTGQPLLGNTSYLIGVSLLPGNTIAPQHYPEKLECQGEVMGSSADQSGNFTEYWRKREYRPGAPRVRAATLYVHGLRDFNVQPITIAGWFDRLPRSTPHKGLFGVWNHAFPHAHSAVEPDWARLDWYDMVTAWFDRYLKGLPTGVERWPDVQVQGSDGQWWAAEEFPEVGGPIGQLALGPGGSLGARAPTGSTSYTEQPAPGTPQAPGQLAVFTTEALKAPLHLTGMPVLDLWVTSSQPDAHIAAELEVLGPDGQPLGHEGTSGEAVATYGVRSLQHIEPMRRGFFEQAQGVPAPVGEPIHLFVRFLPTDLVVPKGGYLRLTISGSVSYSKGDSLTSGALSTITILHDCESPSALRFVMPPRRAHLLNVREIDEREEKLSSRPSAVGRADGGRVALAKVCNLPPKKVSWLTRGVERY
jgi:X-Pro dipeptidyl-peptidase